MKFDAVLLCSPGINDVVLLASHWNPPRQGFLQTYPTVSLLKSVTFAHTGRICLSMLNVVRRKHHRQFLNGSSTGPTALSMLCQREDLALLN